MAVIQAKQADSGQWAVGSGRQPVQATFTPAARVGVGVVAVLAAALVGIAVGLGIPQSIVIMGLLAPFVAMVLLARPHWAAIAYIALVYADLLSVMVRYDGMPALARFAGVALLCAALGYRLFVQRERLAIDRVTLWVLAYGAIVALGLLYARAPDIVMTDVIEFARILFTYLIIINLVTTSSRLHAALYVLLGAGTALASLTIFQYLTGTSDNEYGGLAQYRVSDITASTAGARPGGTIGDANYYGQLLLIVIPIALYLMFEGRSRRGRLAGLGCAAILTAGVVLTYSRGDAIALGAIVIAAVVYKKPKPAWIVGGVAALLLALPFLPANYIARMVTVVDVAQGSQQIYNQDDSILGRTGAAEAAVAMFFDHPILGVGRENYPLYQLDYLAGTPYARAAKGIPPHDLYLEVAAENGIVGIVIFGGLLIATFGALGDAWRRFKWAGDDKEKELVAWLAIMLIGYLVSALSLHGAFIYMLFLQISLIVAARQIARSHTPHYLRMGYLTGALRGHPQPVTTEKPVLHRRGLAIARFMSHVSRSKTSAAVGRHADRPQSAQSEIAAARPEEPPAGVWPAAAEVAFERGNVKVARAMIELALERDLYDEAAWEMHMRVRQAEQGMSTCTSASTSAHGVDSAQYQTFPLADQAPEERLGINERFYSYWRANGGVPIFGYPISPRFAEPDRSGKIIQVQYFERARLEYRAERAATPLEVVPGSLGLEVQVRGRVLVRPPHGLEEEQVIYTARGTGMPTPRKFYMFWECNGGPHLFGYPVTPLLLDVDGQGRELAVQYFEKARLEYHPQLPGTVYEVQISRLGAEIFAGRYATKA